MIHVSHPMPLATYTQQPAINNGFTVTTLDMVVEIFVNVNFDSVNAHNKTAE